MDAGPLGTGALRPDPRFAQCWHGTATIAGFPYTVTAVREFDGATEVLRLRIVSQPEGEARSNG